MATVKDREKRRENRMRKNKRAESLAELDEKELPLEEEVAQLEKSEGDPEIDSLEKDYFAEPYVGPTSYEEMDAVKAAREQADQVRTETYTVQDLVSNIAYSPMTPDDKSKAIVKVGKDFGSRLKAITKVEKEFVDMDLLQLKALIAKDARQTSLIEKATDFLANTFTNPPMTSKAFIRKKLKDAVEFFENINDPSYPLVNIYVVRDSVPALIKSAKDAGVGSSNSILIEKDASGSWRAVLFPTNNFKDRDGEILSEAAHTEYVEWINKNMDCAPVFATWHKAGTARTNPLDFIGYENGIMIASLPLTENEAACILKTQTQFDVGLSIGGIALERDSDNSKIITKYRMFEVSDLPLERAANPFTAIELISKEAQMDSKAMKAYLTGMIGDEQRAEKILENMALTQTELRKAGVEEKEKKTPESAATEEPASAIVNLDELVEKLAKELGMQELSDTIASLQATAEKVPVLEALVKEMATNQDEKLAEMIQPKIQKSLSWMTARPTQKADNILKEDDKDDEKLKKSAPEVSWLSEAFGVQPLQTQ